MCYRELYAYTCHHRETGAELRCAYLCTSGIEHTYEEDYPCYDCHERVVIDHYPGPALPWPGDEEDDEVDDLFNALDDAHEELPPLDDWRV